MTPWFVLGGLAGGVLWLAGRGVYRRKHQGFAADASGLAPAPDLSHLPVALQRTALWTLSDGGFERRVVQGVVSRGGHDVGVTAFDLETLRERRGEWAYLPVEPPFRIGGVVSVVACTIAHAFPHILMKRAGSGDRLDDDDFIERLGSIAKQARDRLGVARSYPAELPRTLATAPIATDLPATWRVYSTAPDVAALVAHGLLPRLEQVGRRDLVIELLEGLVLVYPAAREVAGPDALADLTGTALSIAEGLLAQTPVLTLR